ncbi:MAG TPA: hypothetical protein VII44_10145 [Puia sp.]
MKKIFGLLIIGMGFIQFTKAQDSDGKGFDKSKLFVGGNLGLAFGYATVINVAPLVGYHFSPMFAAGVGLNYSYYSYDDGYNTYYKETYLGMSIFGRVYPIQQFFIQVQPELNYVWGSGYFPSIDQNENSKVNQFVPSLLLGGGAAIPTGGNGAFTISVMYDVIQNPLSPYFHQAVYGFGYNIGF